MTGEPFQTRYWTKLGGINDSNADSFIQVDSELSDARNYMPDEQTSGVLIKREGISKQSANVTSTVSSVYQGRNGNYFTAGTVTYDFTGTSIDTGLTAGYPSWTSFVTYDIMANGSQVRKTSDGTTWSALTDAPSGTKYVAAANNFLYASKGTGSLYWADLGTITFPSVNELVLTADEGDSITGLRAWRNSVFVGHEKSFRLVTGYTSLEQAVSFYSREEGCLSNQSICVTPSGLIWWSRRGITMLQNEMALDFPMQRKLQKTLNGLNRAYDSYVHAVHDPLRKRVRFFLFNGSSTTVNLACDYHYFDDAFYLMDGAGIQMAASGSALISGVTDVYVGGYSSTYLYKVTGTTDDGTAISSYLETARESFGGPSILKMARKVSVSTNLTTSEAITYGAYVDNATSLTKTYSISPASGGVETRIGINASHYKMKHRISDSALTRTRIYGIVNDGYVVRSV